MIKFDNFGFISKKKVAAEIAKIYNGYEKEAPLETEQWLRNCEAQNALNYLCFKLKIKPDHTSRELGGGTGKAVKRNG